MADEERQKKIKALLERREKANTVSQEAARKWLTSEGLLTEEGELQPQFGGANAPGKAD